MSLDVRGTVTVEKVDGPEYKIFVFSVMWDFSVLYVEVICFYIFYFCFEF
jgi:hypothetical protein